MADLRVQHHADGGVDVGSGVDVDVANAICMAQHRNLCVGLDVTHLHKKYGTV